MKHAYWVICFALAACSSAPDVPPELERAAAIIEDVLKPTSLEQSSYAVVLPNGTPKQFVSWYFSTLGTAEWPMSEDSPFAQDEPGVKIPRGVTFHHSAPTGGGKQIVLKWDDARGVVILEGYTSPMEPPVFIKEVPLQPQVVSKSQLAQLTARDALEQGASYQAF
jgi:hypothetical protein